MRKSMYKFNKEKNQHATSVTNKNKDIASSRNIKNQHAKSSMDKISFTKRKNNVQLSRREKSICSKLHEEKSANNKFHLQKTKKQQVP